MKCTSCGTDSRHKDRAHGACPKCGLRFVFEPQSGDPFTDMAFENAIKAVSSYGSVRFLPEHVFYELARRKRKRGGARTAWFGAAAVCVGLGFAAPVFFVGSALSMIFGVVAWPNKTVRADRNHFEALWKRWVAVRGTPQGLIVRREVSGPYRGPIDIPSYSFDRAVICDHGSTVDVLLANNFHFENNCAILSVDGYPQHAFDTVRAMLKNNPRLTVYALHSCTPEGCRLAHRLANEQAWFKGRRVVEVGLRPAHAKAMKGLWLPVSDRPQEGDPISKAERAWLSEYVLDIAAIRPEQVIKRLFACITNDATLVRSDQANDSLAAGGDTYWVDPWTFGSDAHASDGGDDSFG